MAILERDSRGRITKTDGRTMGSKNKANHTQRFIKYWTTEAKFEEMVARLDLIIKHGTDKDALAAIIYINNNLLSDYDVERVMEDERITQENVMEAQAKVRELMAKLDNIPAE